MVRSPIQAELCQAAGSAELKVCGAPLGGPRSFW